MASDNIHIIPLIFLIILLAGSVATIAYNMFCRRGEPTLFELVCASLVNKRSNINLHEIHRSTAQMESTRMKVRVVMFIVTRVMWLLAAAATLVWLSIWCYNGLIDTSSSLATALSTIVTFIGISAVTVKRPKRFDDENNLITTIANTTHTAKQ